MNKMLSSCAAAVVMALAPAVAGLSAANAQDAKAGETKAAMCIGCHGIPGYQASFPEIHKVPMISGQSGKYLVAALQAYRKGERKHPTMKAIAGSLSDQDMADLAAFYEGHAGQDGKGAPVAAPEGPVAELLKKGNCASCHGDNFSKPIDPGYPKIAGQHADYLYVALKAYQVDGNASVGRGNAIMAGMAKPFTHAELKQIANYLATLPTDLRVVAQPRFR